MMPFRRAGSPWLLGLLLVAQSAAQITTDQQLQQAAQQLQQTAQGVTDQQVQQSLQGTTGQQLQQTAQQIQQAAAQVLPTTLMPTAGVPAAFAAPAAPAAPAAEVAEEAAKEAAEKAAEEEAEGEEKEGELGEESEEEEEESAEYTMMTHVQVNCTLPWEKHKAHCVSVKYAEDKESVSAGIMLLGCVTFVMLLFYLVNCSDEDIKHYTWCIVSDTISIFVAVLFYQALMEIVYYYIGKENKENSKVHFSAFLILWVILEVVLYLSCSRPRLLKSLGTVGGHVVAFAGIWSFGFVQVDNSFFNASWAQACLMIPLYLLVCTFLNTITYQIRQVFVRQLKRTGSGHVKEEDMERWIEQCLDSENDFISLCMGFLFGTSMRYLLSGEVPAIEVEPEGKGPSESLYMLLIGVSCGVMLFGSTFVLSKLRHAESAGPWQIRMANIVQGFFAFGMAWCLLFAGEWYFHGMLAAQSLMLAKVYLACILSSISMLSIFGLDFMADRGQLHPRALRHIVTAFGLLVGFTWEGAFDVAVESISLSVRAQELFGSELTCKLFLAAVIIGIVLPAWRYYILEKSFSKEEEESEVDESDEESQLRK